jgi:succinylglutamic semialdehyde dehydrogenase
MGNTIVFKPSDKAPACGQMLAEMLDEAMRHCDAPSGVINLVQGGSDIASALAGGDGVDGVLFTGSWPVGRRITEANLDRPGRMLALEMGGNNAAVVLADANLDQAVSECVRCAFITAGQRCTCTRRVIVHRSIASEFMSRVSDMAARLSVGEPSSEPPVFMGPLISEAARRTVFSAFKDMASKPGAEVLLEMREADFGSGGWYLTPGVLRVAEFVRGPSAGGRIVTAGDDVEVFGPLLRISVVDSLDEAIVQCNATDFGLAASIFTTDPASAEAFRNQVRCGCVNWNTGTAGASSKLPFGGLGKSGNHRPAGAFSTDYCGFPVAGMTDFSGTFSKSPGMP